MNAPQEAKERELFEKSFTGMVSVGTLARKPDGSYEMVQAQYGWQQWLSRATLAQAEKEALQKEIERLRRELRIAKTLVDVGSEGIAIGTSWENEAKSLQSSLSASEKEVARLKILAGEADDHGLAQGVGKPVSFLEAAAAASHHNKAFDTSAFAPIKSTPSPGMVSVPKMKDLYYFWNSTGYEGLLGSGVTIIPGLGNWVLLHKNIRDIPRDAIPASKVQAMLTAAEGEKG